MRADHKRRMLRDMAVFAAAVCAVLFVLAQVLHSREFVIAALVVIPVGAILFNLYERRAFRSRAAVKR